MEISSNGRMVLQLHPSTATTPVVHDPTWLQPAERPTTRADRRAKRAAEHSVAQATAFYAAHVPEEVFEWLSAHGAKLQTTTPTRRVDADGKLIKIATHRDIKPHVTARDYNGRRNTGRKWRSVHPPEE